MVDPFCGTGSVGVAAAMLGGFAVLSDVDKATFRNVRFHLQRLLALPEFAPTTGLLCAGEQELKENLPEADAAASQGDAAKDEEDAAFGGDDDDFITGPGKGAVKFRELGSATAKNVKVTPSAPRATPAAAPQSSSSSSSSAPRSTPAAAQQSSSSSSSSANVPEQRGPVSPITVPGSVVTATQEDQELHALLHDPDGEKYGLPADLGVGNNYLNSLATDDGDDDFVAASQEQTQVLTQENDGYP